MSGLGIPQTGLSNILSLARPDLAAEQMQVQQRQAFANSLLQQQPQYTGVGGALDTLGSKLLGALTAKNANKRALDIANQYRGALFDPSGGQGPAPSAQSPASPPLASMPQSGLVPPTPGQPNSGVQTRPMPPLGSLPPGGLQAPQQPQQVAGNPVPAPMGQPQQGQQQPPQGGQSLFDRAVPDMPGVDPRNKFAMYASDPAGYMKAYYDRTGQTNEYKNALVASAGDPLKAAQLLQAQANKSASIEVRPEGYVIGPDSRITYGPNENSNVYYTTGPHNEPVAHPIPGGAQAAAAFEGQKKGAESENTVEMVELPNGKHVPMYVGSAIGPAPATQNAQQQPLGIRNNNPGNLQPGGQESSFANNTAGILAASSNLDNYAKSGINTLSGIVSKWAPQYDASGKQINDTPAYIADVSKRLGGIDPSRPLNLSDPNVKGALLEAMFQHENGNKGNVPPAAGPQGNGPPELGQSTAQAEVNKAAGEAAANTGHVQGSSDALLKAIDGMIAINDQVPDSTFLGPETKAAINERAPNLPGFRGDAGALQQWEQMNSIGILGGIKNLGMGRTDIPIVKQVVAGGGIPASIPAADRIRLLQTLRTEVMNNKAAAQNTAANLNAPNAASPASAPMQSYPGAKPQQKVRVYNPQTQRIE